MPLVLASLAAVACGSTTFPAEDIGVRVSLTLASGWSGLEQVDHVTLIATSSDRTAVVCFGSTTGSPSFQPTMTTGNTVDPCADDPRLTFTTTPPLLNSLSIFSRAITADLEFPAGESVEVSAFAALAGSAMIGQAAGSARGQATAGDGYADLALALTKQDVALPSACGPRIYTGAPSGSAPCGTEQAGCIGGADKGSGDAEHDARVTCASSSSSGFFVQGIASSCAAPAIAWRHAQGSLTCGTYGVQLAFYRCADDGAADGGAGDASASCARTTACTPPSVVLTTTKLLGAAGVSSLDIGACVPPSVFPLSFTVPSADGTSLNVSVTPVPEVDGLPGCDVEFDVLEASTTTGTCTGN